MSPHGKDTTPIIPVFDFNPIKPNGWEKFSFSVKIFRWFNVDLKDYKITLAFGFNPIKPNVSKRHRGTGEYTTIATGKGAANIFSTNKYMKTIILKNFSLQISFPETKKIIFTLIIENYFIQRKIIYAI